MPVLEKNNDDELWWDDLDLSAEKHAFIENIREQARDPDNLDLNNLSIHNLTDPSKSYAIVSDRVNRDVMTVDKPGHSDLTYPRSARKRKRVPRKKDGEPGEGGERNKQLSASMTGVDFLNKWRSYEKSRLKKKA